MEILPATVEHAGMISDLIRSFDAEVAVQPGSSGIEPYVASTSSEAEARYIASSRYVYRVALRDSHLLGVVAVRDRTHLFHLFVAREAQRRGIGRKLWHAALSAVDPSGTAKVFTVNSTVSGLSFYEHLGFSSTGSKVEAHGICFIPMQRSVGDERG